MKIRTLAAIACLCGLAALAFFWANRDPLARLSEPTGYIYTTMELIDAETGQPVALEEYGPFGAMFAAMGDELAQAAEQGYLMVNPADRTASLVALGITATAPLPASGQESAFDTGSSGAGPIFLTYSPREDRFTVRAPETALGLDLAFHLSFERAAQGIAERVETQNDLKARRQSALAEWNQAMDKLQAQLPPAPHARPLSYRLNLPGDLGTISAPMTAGLDSPEGDGFYLLRDRATDREWLGIRLDSVETLAETFAAHRNELLDSPDDDTRLLYEDKETLVVARRDQPIYFLRVVPMDDMGYLIRAEPEDGAQLEDVWHIATSLSTAHPDPGAIPAADFDALSRFASQGFDLVARSEFGKDLGEEFVEQTSKRLSVQGLLARFPSIRINVQLRPAARIDDPFATGFDVNLACEPRLKTNDSPTVLHDRLSSNPVFDGLAHREMDRDHLAVLIARKAYQNEAEFEFDPVKDRPARSAPVWSLQSASAVLGADNLSYFVYRARDLGGPFELICAASSDNPYAAQAVLQIIGRHDLPDSSDMPPAIAGIFRDYEQAWSIGADLYKARKPGNADDLLLAADGSVLSDILFDWSWEFDELHVFETRNLQGKHALWTYEGEQLLPYDYDEIDDSSDGMIVLQKDGETLLYSPANRRFEPAAP